MADEDKTVYIGIELDKQAQSRFNTAIDAASSKLKTLGNTTSIAGDEFPKAARSTELFLQGLTKAAAAAKNYEENIANAVDKTKQLNDAQSESGGGFAVEGLRRTGGALTQLGLGDIGQPIQRLGDVAQVGKELDQLKDNITSVGAESLTSAAALGVAGIAVAGLTIAFKIFTDGLNANEAVVQKASDANKLYYEAIQSGTTETIKVQIAALQAQKDIADQQANDARNSLIKALQSQGGDVFSELAAALAAKPFKDELDKQTAASEAAQQKIDVLNKALNSSTVATNDATEATLKNADAIKKAKAEEQADAVLTVEAAKAKLKAQQDLLQQDFEAYAALEASGDKSKATTDKMAALQKEMDALTAEIGRLSDQTIPAAQHVKDLADAEKDHAKALQDANKVMKDETAAVQKQHADMANAVQKADADIMKINEQSAQKKIDIERKYQDALVSAAEKALQSAQDALRRLHDEREKLTIDFGRGELDATRKAQYDDLTAQIKGQEEQTKAYREHLQRLQDIQRSAQEQDAQDALNRNFLAIFERKLSTRTAMEGENTSFGRSEQERSIAQQQAASDAERQRAFDRQQRLIAYQQANADAQRNYQLQLRDNQIAEQRAIAQARQAKTVELSDLAHATSQALAIRHQSLVAELQLITQGEQQKLAIQAQFYQRAVQLLNNAVQSVGRTAGGATNAALMHATALQTTQIIGQTFGVRS